MQRITPPKKYTTVSIPQEFYDEIKSHVLKYKTNYVSLADFIRQAAREQMKSDISSSLEKRVELLEQSIVKKFKN